ncbi:hypothetical protein ACJJTC_015139 [Scirpophaga incertulas]
MFSKKPVSWFLTDSGRKFSFAFITGTGIIFTASKFVPHTLLLNKYKEFVHYYRDAKPVELSKELQDRCQSCFDLLSLSDVHRNLISPFSVTGFDLFHAGSTCSKFGVAVGIPVNFTYKTLEDVAKDKILVFI